MAGSGPPGVSLQPSAQPRLGLPGPGSRGAAPAPPASLTTLRTAASAGRLLTPGPAGRRGHGRHPGFFSPVRSDGGVLSPSQVASHFSRTPAHLHGGAQAARSLPPIVHTTISLRPTGARVPRHSAGPSGVAHNAQSGRISGAASHFGSGGALESRPPSWIYRSGRGRRLRRRFHRYSFQGDP
ncbi:hypothetical protein NDU88_004249 [Pleurodeles waltl]|uniref:Uncharacterized protein n=1 Tax=Pleurodeles waltl TaxID=8319 RepID=A0AAV7UET8_PLEWA|nr:hypothetical protein NDU88_004249 [Pleurodeles waltl]